ncbi:hypothetical protein HYV87_04940 [Candidatus Woesearchaeota archaeon]|nr:hypothetical protein [Candidatus Woesearchaeota archaeon]MBI2582442.1 hypothetical protein [Candidatus Woesearchaeota archaeon]
MKKEFIAGLTALMLSCNPVNINSTEPIFIYSSQARHRGVPLAGEVYLDIQIIGPPEYTQRMKDSLDRVYQTPFWYFVHDNLTAIRFQPPSKVHVEDGVFDSDDNTSTGKKHQPEAWIDSELVHEACHVYLYRSGRETWGYNAEKECMRLQNEYLLHINAQNLLVDVDKMLLERFWEKENRWW